MLQAGNPIVALVGPTASGKSAVALELAPWINGEIVSVDSMQVYRGMDVGTAKPDARARNLVSHHLIDIFDLNQPSDAATFRDAALPAIDDILARGRTPILCGGTGFYFAVLCGRLADVAGSRPTRVELEATPNERLLDELLQRDPETYARIDRRNRRRLIRAVEVLRLTGRPLANPRTRATGSGPARAWANEASWTAIGLMREAEDLKARIESRVDEMFDRGLVAETQRLLANGLETNRVALQAIGYRQVVDYLRGDRALPETRDLVKSKTRQLAKRQMTWFRRQMRVTWLKVGPDESPVETADRIARLIGLKR
jgi:tRNA dimethylallyltransferase